MGWKHAGTMNLNIQYGKMTMTLIAQTAIHMLRERIGNPIAEWDSEHLSKDFLKALEAEGVNPTIPWLYDFKLDFRFK